MVINSENDGTVPGFGPVCNVHTNIKKRSRPLDTHQEQNKFSSDRVKERWCQKNRLQTLRTTLHQTMDHSSDRLLKLNPYLILDTDPTLDNLNYSNTFSKSPHLLENKNNDHTTQSMYELEQNDRRNHVLEFHYNSRQRGGNENCVDQDKFNNIDKCSYTSINPLNSPCKILSTVIHKPLISKNCMQNKGCSSLTIINRNNKDLRYILNQKMLVNQERAASLMPVESKKTFKSMKKIKDIPKVKESLMITKEDKQIIKQTNPKPELIPNNDIYEKQKTKPSDKNSSTLTTETRKQTDDISNTNVFPINSLKTHMITKDDKQIIEQINPKPELIPNNDIYEKQKTKPSDKNSSTLTTETRKQTDDISNTNVFPINSLKTHMISKDDKQIIEQTNPKPELIPINDFSEKQKTESSDKNSNTLNSKTREQTDDISNTNVFPINSLKTHMITKDDKQLIEQTNPKPELIPINDIYEKHKTKLSDENGCTLTPKTRKQTDDICNTSVFPINALRTHMITKDDKQIIEQTNPKPELIPNNDIYEKQKTKPSDKNGSTSTPKIRKQTDDICNTSVFPINALKTHMDLTSENARKSLKSPIEQTHKRIEQNCMTDDPNKLTFDHLFSSVQKQEHNFEYHSALRPSLFSNMPPYIRFSSHDVKGESFPLFLQKILKWKLSSITPIVVRRTIQNSGFKLVRSEHCLVQNTTDPSVISNQSNQNTISLQNHCGVTPPIVDAFCGIAPPPNELMMLPRSQSNDWVGTWGKHMKSLCFKSLWEQQKLNHFPGTFQIGRKDRLWKNLQRLMFKFGKEQFGFTPISYILPQEARILRQVWEKNDEDKWIIKPPASARGSGIRVISKWAQIPKKIPLVVQRYIDNPYLINETKFDLRLYILITSINPLRLYLYDNGLVRFASVKYSSDLSTICDRYMHLTNYSINRLSSQYTENEDANACQGHKWTLRSLWTYMEKERKVDVKKLWKSLEDLVVKTVISGESPMSQMCNSNLSNRYNSYELFGIDVLFDEYLKPWILEVNISPSLHSSSPLDLAVKGPLVKDLMNMAGYHIPNKMSRSTHNTLLKMLGVKSRLCYDKRLYTFNLSTKEKEKQEYYTNIKSRVEYIDSILNDLLPDDIRHLIVYEDELTQIGSFQKVFPTTSSFEYHKFFDSSRYYNRLLDAWECKYSNNRGEGIAVLEKLCQSKIHLEVPDIDEQKLKTCDIHQNTQTEVEKMLEKSGGDKISDNYLAVNSGETIQDKPIHTNINDPTVTPARIKNAPDRSTKNNDSIPVLLAQNSMKEDLEHELDQIRKYQNRNPDNN